MTRPIPSLCLLGLLAVACQGHPLRPATGFPAPTATTSRRPPPATPSLTDTDRAPPDGPLDRDGDGIVDAVDRCPETAGPPRTDGVHHGCPLELPLTCKGSVALSEWGFAPGESRLGPNSLAGVPGIIAALRDTGPDSSLRIAGRRSPDEPTDLGLARARAVREGLVEAGIPDQRIRLVNEGAGTSDGSFSVGSAQLDLAAGCAQLTGPHYEFQEPIPPRPLPQDSPARRTANLSPAACRAQLKLLELPLARDRRPTPGVATGVRFAGPVSGVTFIAPGRSSPFGVMDCRLALTLSELAPVLAKHGVTSVHLDNVYRRDARLPRHRRHRSQHAYGLAADMTAFTLDDGSMLQIERDWHGRIGDPVCGSRALVADPTEASIALRNLVCDLARRGFFHTMLTPNYDAAHADHLHVDIKRDQTSWGIH